jgi:hypothetical protein
MVDYKSQLYLVKCQKSMMDIAQGSIKIRFN